MVDIDAVKKVELHCHVDGLLNPQIIEGMPQHNLAKSLLPALRKHCPVTDFRSWAEEYGPAVYPAVSNKGEFLLSVMREYLRSLKEQNVVYAEIMLSSFTFQHDDIDRQVALYQKYRDVADEVGEGFLQTEFLIAIGRTHDRQKMEKRLQRILSIEQAGLVRGVAVAGFPEEPNTIKPYGDLFEEWENAGLGIEIHAGELGGPLRSHRRGFW